MSSPVDSCRPAAFTQGRRSAALCKRSWGENVIGQSAMDAVFLLVYDVVIVPEATLVLFMVIALKSGAVIASTMVALILALQRMGLVQRALAGLYAAAVYRFATERSGTAGLDHQALQLPFQANA